MKRLSLALIGTCLLAMQMGCASSGGRHQASGEIYDPAVDGERLLARAAATARKEHKLVLLDLGANWCSDSQATYRLLRTDPAIRRELKRHYVLTMVDVNQKDNANRNEALVQSLGNPIGRGIPVLLVLTPDGKLLNSDPAERLKDDAYKDPTRVLAYLEKWAAALPPR
ncbi:MAG: thioredoxin family protein [Verrucomicrobiota bacterium]